MDTGRQRFRRRRVDVKPELRKVDAQRRATGVRHVEQGLENCLHVAEECVLSGHRFSLSRHRRAVVAVRIRDQLGNLTTLEYYEPQENIIAPPLGGIHGNKQDVLRLGNNQPTSRNRRPHPAMRFVSMPASNRLFQTTVAIES